MAHLTRSERLITGSDGSDDYDNHSRSDEQDLLAQQHKHEPLLKWQKVYNYVATFVAFCCAGSIGYVIYLHSIEIKRLLDCCNNSDYDIYYLGSPEHGYLIVGIAVNSAFLLFSYIMIFRWKSRFNSSKLCANVWECQLHFKRVYFPKCKLNKFFASFILSIFGITTPIYFMANILPIFLYGVNKSDCSDVCETISKNIDTLYDDYGWDNGMLQSLFRFQFWWWLGTTILYMLSFCLAEEYKRQSWQRGSSLIISGFLIFSFISSIFLFLIASSEIQLAYGLVGVSYVVTFILQLTMF